MAGLPDEWRAPGSGTVTPIALRRIYPRSAPGTGTSFNSSEPYRSPKTFSSPLATHLPIAYHPIEPITRALQLELAPPQFIDFSEGFSALIAECISRDDPVGVASRSAWSLASADLTDKTRSISIAVEETLSVSALREAIARYRPQILVISAHGFFEPDRNLAGLVIGDEHSIRIDLGPMPPLVILSACHSAPRGGSVVAVTDLLLRAGATAVVSTLVPVDVRHNSTFMTRFLVYLSEAVAGATSHVNVLSVWHRVQSSNVIIDIALGNPYLAAWAGTGKDGAMSPVSEYMSGRAVGRVSPIHMYRDAEEILLEIAAEQGMRPQVAGWLRDPGYLREAMMYTMVGDPSSIRLQHD